jgi:hypothetical protein
LAKAGRHPKNRVRERPNSTLADQGIDKHLADRMRKAWRAMDFS